MGDMSALDNMIVDIASNATDIRATSHNTPNKFSNSLITMIPGTGHEVAVLSVSLPLSWNASKVISAADAPQYKWRVHLPGIGWANRERQFHIEHGQKDLVPLPALPGSRIKLDQGKHLTGQLTQGIYNTVGDVVNAIVTVTQRALGPTYQVKLTQGTVEQPHNPNNFLTVHDPVRKLEGRMFVNDALAALMHLQQLTASKNRWYLQQTALGAAGEALHAYKRVDNAPGKTVPPMNQRVEPDFWISLTYGDSLEAPLLPHNLLPGIDMTQLVTHVHATTFQTFYIYCNFVQPRFVGDGNHSLLVRIPNPGLDGCLARGELVHQVMFSNPYYLPLKEEGLQQLTFDIVDDEGASIQFAWGAVQLTLRIRRSSL